MYKIYVVMDIINDSAMNNSNHYVVETKIQGKTEVHSS